MKNAVLLAFIRDKVVHNTHEWIAFKVVESLDEPWQSVFIKHIEKVLKGSKVPDKEFKDWKNHVFHPPQWGGAPQVAEEWLRKFKESILTKKWADAAFALGVLSHYIADPIHPLHTGQTEDEKKVHKFHEFGTSLSLKRYDDIKPSPMNVSNLAESVKEAALKAHMLYFDVINLYDYSKGSEFAWDKGITDELHQINRDLLHLAVSLVYSVVSQTLKSVKVEPPKYHLSLKALAMRVKVPIYFLKKWLEKRYMKKVTKNMLKELKKKGKIYQSLPDDDRGLVDYFNELAAAGKLNMEKARKSFEERRVPEKKARKEIVEKPQTEKDEVEVVKKQEERREWEIAHPERKQKARLKLTDPVDKAPEIGRKTASKLNSIGIYTIDDLLKADYNKIKGAISWVKEEDLERWKIETKLMLEIPGTRVKDVVYMYHLGIRSPEDLRDIDEAELKKRLNEFMKTKEAGRIKRWIGELTDDDIRRWKELIR